MAVNIDIEPRRRGLHLPPKVILPIGVGVIALGAIGLALSRGGESNSQTLPVPQAQGQDVPPPAGTDGDGEPPKKDQEVAVAAPLQPTEVAPPLQVEPPPPKLKPLPDVINSQSFSSKILSIPEVKALNGGDRMGLPETPWTMGLSFKEIKTKAGQPLIAIFGKPSTPNINLPVLLDSKVKQALTGQSANFSSVTFVTESGKIWSYAVPSPGTSAFSTGVAAQIGETAISFTYNPSSLESQNWIAYLARQFADAPQDTVAILTGTQGFDMGEILFTPDGSIVIISLEKGK